MYFSTPSDVTKLTFINSVVWEASYLIAIIHTRSLTEALVYETGAMRLVVAVLR